MAGRRGSAPPEFPCGDCKKEVKKTQKALLCGLCNRWYHASCQNVNDQLYEGLCKDSDRDHPQAFWYCEPTCNTLANKVVNNLAKLELKVERLTHVVNDVDDRVKRIEEGNLTEPMIDALRAINQNDHAGTTALEKEEMENMMDCKAKEQLAEAENRARRQTNLIIFRLPESKDGNEEHKKQEDTKRVLGILNKVKSNQEPLDIRRLGNNGQKKGNEKRDRPIRITFQSQIARDETLKAMIKAKKELSSDENAENLLNVVTFRKDMTPQERKEDEKLYNLLKQRREESRASGDDTAKWVVRSGQVVNKNKKPAHREAGNKENLV